MNSQHQRIDTIVFDCGDTLVHLRPSREMACLEVLSEINLIFSEEQVAEAMLLADASEHHRSSEMRGDASKRSEFYRRYNGRIAMRLGIGERLDEFSRLMQQRIPTRCSWVPFEGSVEVLSRLGERYRLFVLANWDLKLENLLEEVGLLSNFSSVLSSEQLGAEKPDQAAFDAFVRMTGVEPHHSAYVGNDYEPDVFGSRRAGFTPVLLDHLSRYTTAVDCCRVTSFDELCTLLLPSGQGEVDLSVS